METIIYLVVLVFVAACWLMIYLDVRHNRNRVTVRTIVSVKDAWLYDELRDIPTYIREGKSK